MEVTGERVDNLSRLDGVRVLIVDDSAVIRELLAATLEECGASVTAVGTAEAALEVVVRERPDVLVSDLQMPDKGGPEHRASTLRAGFQDHVEKPVDLQTLVGVVASFTRKPPDPRPSVVTLSPTG